MSQCPCPVCKGRRLKMESLAVTVGGSSIYDFTTLPVSEALGFMEGLTLTRTQSMIADQILKEIRARLGFLRSVGLQYLTLSRSAATLSGGESQRIRLATQIGSSLMGVLYILDEPSSCWRRCGSSGTWATPSSWWSTTRTPCGRRTILSMWAPARASMAGISSLPAPRRRCPPTLRPLPASTSAGSGISPSRRSGGRAAARPSRSGARQRTTCGASTWTFPWGPSPASPACPGRERAPWSTKFSSSVWGRT